MNGLQKQMRNVTLSLSLLMLLFLLSAASICSEYDGICEQDPDEDGICTESSVIPPGNDNCPEIANPDQADDDSDGLGNVCDECPLNDNPFCARAYDGTFQISYYDPNFPDEPFIYPMTIETIAENTVEIIVDYSSEDIPQKETGQTTTNDDGTFYAEIRSNRILDIVITGTNLQNNETMFDDFTGNASTLSGDYQFLFITDDGEEITNEGTYEAIRTGDF